MAEGEKGNSECNCRCVALIEVWQGLSEQEEGGREGHLREAREEVQHHLDPAEDPQRDHQEVSQVPTGELGRELSAHTPTPEGTAPAENPQSLIIIINISLL